MEDAWIAAGRDAAAAAAAAKKRKRGRPRKELRLQLAPELQQQQQEQQQGQEPVTNKRKRKDYFGDRSVRELIMQAVSRVSVTCARPADCVVRPGLAGHAMLKACFSPCRSTPVASALGAPG